MQAPNETRTTTMLVWLFTEQQARNATLNQLAGGEEFFVDGSWTLGAANQTIRSTVKMNTTTLENALTGAQSGDVITVSRLIPPENGMDYIVTATRTVTVGG